MKIAAVIIAFASIMILIPAPTQAAVARTAHQYVGDVTGDGKADAVTLDIRTGDWWVAPSNGSIFTTPSRWKSGFGVGTSKQFLADVNADDKADAITFDSITGDWWVAISTGSNTFGTPSRWIAGHGYKSQNQLVGDVNGDGRADAAAFFDDPSYPSEQQVLCLDNVCRGSWYVALSVPGGNAFATFGGGLGRWDPAGQGVGSTNQMLADINGDNKADAVVFYAKTGDWWARVSNGTSFISAVAKHLASGEGHGKGSTWQAMADVNGDNQIDAAFSWMPNASATGFSLSDGNGFVAYTAPLSPVGWGNSNAFMADVTGDGNADNISYDANTGNWTPVSIFPYAGGGAWITGFGVGTK